MSVVVRFAIFLAKIQTNDQAYHNPPHLPSTYTSLLALALLRDDFSRLNRMGLLSFVRSCQASDGS